MSVEPVVGYLAELGAQLDSEAEADRLGCEVRAFIRRFCVLPDEHCLTAVTLWAMHTHTIGHCYTTPRLIASSPEVASGKTRVLEVLDLLVPHSMLMLSPSPATLFRKLAKDQVTLLVDESDTIFKQRGKNDTNEELRGFLNSGYRRGATIPRCVGPRHDVVDFPVFAATALAGLGELPDTILSRSIILRMRRRAPHEKVENFRLRTHAPIGHALRDRLKQWAEEAGARVGAAEPPLPEGITDRAAECWEPLIAVADDMGGKWPRIAREACVTLCKVSADRRVSLGVRLLSDIRLIFRAAGFPDAIHTETLVERLRSGEGLEDDAPWNDLHGQPLGKRGLASKLQPYGVRPTKVKVRSMSLQGYRRETLGDAWVRYCGPLPLASESPEQPEPTEPDGGFAERGDPKVPKVPEVRGGEEDNTEYF